jgi:hypothetical protein
MVAHNEMEKISTFIKALTIWWRNNNHAQAQKIEAGLST